MLVSSNGESCCGRLRVCSPLQSTTRHRIEKVSGTSFALILTHRGKQYCIAGYTPMATIFIALIALYSEYHFNQLTVKTCWWKIMLSVIRIIFARRFSFMSRGCGCAFPLKILHTQTSKALLKWSPQAKKESKFHRVGVFRVCMIWLIACCYCFSVTVHWGRDCRSCHRSHDGILVSVISMRISHDFHIIWLNSYY